MFVLFNIIFAFAAIVIDNVLGMSISAEVPYGPFYIIYLLVVLIPGLAVLVRRLHDIGKSGWWFLIVLIPFIGNIWLLVLLAKDSTDGSNEYGPNPKGVGNDDAADHIVEAS